jgi:hypothetical protein
MTGEQLLDLLMFRLGHRANPTIRAAAALEMALVQQDLLEKDRVKAWFLLQDYTNAAFKTVTDQEWVALPTGFLGVPGRGNLYYQDPDSDGVDTWEELNGGDWGLIKNAYKDREENGSPEVWALLGSRIYLRPIPNRELLLRLPCYIADTAPTDTATTNLWLTEAPNWLLSETLFQVAAKHIKDPELAGVAKTESMEARNRFVLDSAQREAQIGSRSMGGED